MSTPNVVITSINGDVVPSQTNLLWKEGVKTETEKYEVFFVATVPALGLATYAIRYYRLFYLLFLFGGGEICTNILVVFCLQRLITSVLVGLAFNSPSTTTIKMSTKL